MNVRSLPELLANPPEMPEFVLNPRLLPRGGRALVFGASGIGKSMLVHGLSFALAAGTPWLGFAIDRPYRVLYLLAEGGEYSLWERSRDLQATLKLPNEAGRRLFLTYNLEAVMDNGPGQAEIQQAVLDCGAEVVIMDPAYKLMKGNDADGDVAKAFVRSCDKLIAASGAALVIVHHSKKAAFDDNGFKIDRGRAEARGHSTFTEDFWDLILQLKKAKATGHSLVVEKTRHAKEDFAEPIPLVFDKETTVFRRRGDGGDPYLALISEQWQGLGEVRQGIESTLQLSEKTVRERMRELKEAGMIETMVNPERKNEHLVRKVQVA